MGTPRNAPCPCGSGKKYKKCCLALEHTAQAGRVEAQRHSQALSWAIGAATDWLVESRWQDELLDWIDVWLTPDEVERLQLQIERAGPHHRDQLFALTFDHWLCDCTVDVFDDDGEPALLGEILLGDVRDPESRPLRVPDDLHRRWLEAWLATPLRLYRVVSADPGHSITAEDLLSGEEHTVHERTGSRSVTPGLCFAARIVTTEGGPKMFVNLWPLSEEAMGAAGVYEVDEDEDDDEVVGDMARHAWLRSYVPLLPELVDQKSGDPITLIEFRYRAIDWEEVERRFSVEDDWRGSRKDDWVWLETPEADHSSVRGSVYVDPDDPDVVVAFARTARRAQELRVWFERAMGDAVEFLGMDETAPEQLQKAGSRSSLGTPSLEAPLPPDQMTGVIERVYRKQYEGFLDIPLPMLGNRTPRAALPTEEGRRKVEELIELYERNERDMARSQGRPEASLAFLRRAVEKAAAEGT